MTEAWTPSDLINLVKACKEAGVREFRLGELSLCLGSEASPTQSVEQQIQSPYVEHDPQNEERVLLQNEQNVRQEQLDYLRLADPLAYEELIEQEELTNDR